MGKKIGHSAEEIIRKLRQSDVLLSQGTGRLRRYAGRSASRMPPTTSGGRDYGGLGV